MDERATTSETEQWTSRLRPETLGEAFGVLFAASIASFFLSLIGLVLYLLVLPEENPTVTLADPPVAAAVASWIGILVSTFCYGTWSAWQLRTLSRDSDRPTSWNPVNTLAYAIAVFVADNDDLDASDWRLRRTLWALFGVVSWLVFTAAMLYGSPPG